MAGFDDCADGINVLTSTTPTDGTDAVNACKVAQGSCEIAIDRMGFHCSTIDGTSLEVTCRQVLDNVAAAFEGIVVTQCEGYVSN